MSKRRLPRKPDRDEHANTTAQKLAHRIAVYARLATDPGNKAVARQLRECIAHAHERYPDAEPVPFVDAECSGLRWNASLLRMMKAVATGEINRVLVSDRSRIPEVQLN